MSVTVATIAVDPGCFSFTEFWSLNPYVIEKTRE